MNPGALPTKLWKMGYQIPQESDGITDKSILFNKGTPENWFLILKVKQFLFDSKASSEGKKSLMCTQCVWRLF